MWDTLFDLEDLLCIKLLCCESRIIVLMYVFTETTQGRRPQWSLQAFALYRICWSCKLSSTLCITLQESVANSVHGWMKDWSLTKGLTFLEQDELCEKQSYCHITSDYRILKSLCFLHLYIRLDRHEPFTNVPTESRVQNRRHRSSWTFLAYFEVRI